MRGVSQGDCEIDTLDIYAISYSLDYSYSNIIGLTKRDRFLR